MSTTIDNKVVEMRFDNRDFESNVKTTMSTLDKLKSALKLDGVTKSFDGITSASKKVNLTGLQNGIESVHSKFSALDVIAVTTLANITNSAVNAGKRITAALTIEPITSGLREYETQINSVQTILANTQKEGTNIQQVNAALDELNEYADRTIYNFTEMTRNIGTFTAAGVKLDTSVSAIKGIANLAALSGSSSQQASTAMYQLSQALAAGKVQLMDWNSVVNAGMGGQLFQDALIRTSELLGTGAKQAIETAGTFRESLTKSGWLTTEVLTETLKQLSGAYTEADLMAQGFTAEQAAEIAKLANSADEAATKVKTFTQMWDVLKETAQSGWAKTWRLIFGDFEQAKNLFTPLTKFFSDIVQSFSDSRNALLENALSTMFEGIDSKTVAKKLGLPIEEVVKNLDKLDGRMILLESFGNILESISRIAKTVGGAFKEAFKPITSDQVFHGIVGFHRLTEALVMSEENADKLKRTFRGLFGVIKIFTSLISGGFGVAFKVLVNILEKFDLNLLDVAATIGDVLYYFSDFITFGETAQLVFKGLGDIFDSVVKHISNFIKNIVGVDIGSAFTSFGGIRNVPGIKQIIDALEWAYNKISDYAKKFAGLDFASGINKILTDTAKSFKNFMGFMKSLTWNDVINALTNFGDKVRENFTKLKEKFEEIGPDLIEGLQNGLKEGIDTIIEKMKEIGEKIIEAIKAVLGIHSPSTVMFEIGQNIVQGLINGIKSLIGGVAEIFRGLGDAITEAIGPIDWGAVSVAIFGAGMFLTLYKFTDALQGFAMAAKSVAKPFEEAGTIIQHFKTITEQFAAKTAGKNTLLNVSSAIKILAESIAILATAVGALTLLDQGKLWNSVGVIGALAAIIGALTIALDKFATSGKPIEVVKISGIILSLGAAFVMLGVAAKIMGNVDEAAYKNAERVLIAFGLCVAALMLATGAVNNKWVTADLDKASSFIAKIGGCFVLLGIAAKLLGTIDDGEFSNAERMIALFGGVVSKLIFFTLFAGPNVDKASRFIAKIGSAFLLLAATSKILGSMKPSEMDAARQMIAAFTLSAIGLIVATDYAGDGIDKASGFILKVTGAIALLAVAAKVAASINPDDYFKIAVVMAALGAVVVALTLAAKTTDKSEMVKISGTLIAMSLAIGVLAGIAALLGFIKFENLAKGVVAVAALSAMMVAMTKATKDATDVKGSMLGMAAAIGVMAIAIAALSLIEPEKLFSAMVALGAVMGMFALMESQAGKSAGAMGALIAMSVTIGILGVALYALSNLPVDSVLGSAIGLSVVLGAIAAAILILDRIGKVSVSAMGSVALLTAVVGILAGVLYILRNVDPESAISNALALSTFLIAMSAVTLILSKIGTGAKVALGGAAAMMGVISIIGVVIGAIGGLINGLGAMEEVEAALNTGMRVMNKIGEAIGSFISSIGVGLTSGLPEIGNNLSAFGEAIKPFTSAVGGIDPSIGSTIESLGVGLLSLTASGLIEQLTSFFGGESNIDTVIDDLPKLGEGLAGFCSQLDEINPEIASSGAKAFSTIVKAMSQIPKEGGIFESFLGKQNFEGFGGIMASIGDGVKQFSDSVGDINAETITPKVEALKTIISAFSEIPKEGGLLGGIFGDADYSNFGTGMTDIGEGLKSFAENTSGIEDTTKISTAAEALKILIQAMSEIPESGGWLSAILGGKDYSAFGTGLSSLGTAMMDFYISISEITNPSILASAVNATSILINGLASVTNTGSGLLADMMRGKNFVMFSVSLSSLGAAISAYAKSVAEATYSNVSASVEAAKAILGFVNDTANVDTSGVDNFATAVDTLSKINISALVTAFEGASEKLAGAGKSLIQAVADGLSSSSSLTDAAETMINNTISSISNKVADFGPIGIDIIGKIVEGIVNDGGNIKTKLEEVLKNAKTSADTVANTFSSVGENIGAGIVSGMQSYITPIANKAREMVRSAKKAAEDEAVIKSPSRVFRNEIGGNIGKGLVLGLNDYISPVYDKSKKLGRSAIDGASEALLNIPDMINLDANMNLNPVITPVLDLDNIKNGSSAIDSMLSKTAPIGVLRDVSSINRQMNRNIQNGGNSDVVSAIDKLRKGLKDIGGNSYNINGITYDDGSAISEAVESLIRATRIQGRV